MKFFRIFRSSFQFGEEVFFTESFDLTILKCNTKKYMNPTVESTFLQTAKRWFEYYKGLAERTFAQLGEDDFYYAPNEESNSIAIIIQHMAGNMISRWTNFLTEDGEKAWRARDDEFEPHKYSKQELIEIWDNGWNRFLETMESLTENDLMKTIYIRKEPLFVIDAINRQLAHYPHHVGQILYIGKMIKGANWKNLSMEKKTKQ